MPQNGFPQQNAVVLAFNNLKGGLFDAKSGARMLPAWTHSGAPSNGTSGTLAGYAGPGALLITDEPALYQNTNTLASPTWTAAPLTGAAGVTSGTINGAVIGGTTPAAGTFTNLSATGYIDNSIAIGLAAVGTARASALALTHQFNVVATAASSAVGVVLPASASVGVGGIVRVYNDGPSNSFHVYAAGTDTIDGTAGSTGVALTNAFYCDYLLGSAGAFLSYRQPITRSA